jgi:hypothetical protein
MTESVNADISNDELVSMLDEATDVVTSFVVPLYVDDRGRPSQFGSGFFVKDGSRHFLVSAAHVLEVLRTKRVYYYVAPSTTADLSGELRLNPWVGDRENDPIDIGVVLVDGPPPPYREVSKFAMDVSYFQPQLLPRSGKVYAIAGFPSSQHRVNPIDKQVVAAVYAYRNRSAPEAEYAAHGGSPDTHVVLPLDLKGGVDSSGKHRNFPRPRGMSGSPIWVLVDEETPEDHRVFPVVAVATKYRKRTSAILATDISFALGMMRDVV